MLYDDWLLMLACFEGFERCGKLWEECIRKHDGFADYKIDMTSLSYGELFDEQDVVYLTPDSPTGMFLKVH